MICIIDFRSVGLFLWPNFLLHFCLCKEKWLPPFFAPWFSLLGCEICFYIHFLLLTTTLWLIIRDLKFRRKCKIHALNLFFEGATGAFSSKKKTSLNPLIINIRWFLELTHYIVSMKKQHDILPEELSHIKECLWFSCRSIV